MGNGGLPGNPTPPLTPSNASGMIPAPPGYSHVVAPVAGAGGFSGARMGPGGPCSRFRPELKGPVHFAGVPEEAETKLIIPVREGVILRPFRLEHNLPCQLFPFSIKPDLHLKLMNE